MKSDKITIKGAREHNLKNIDVEIPREKFVVITGVSGSGKSSLAFDTLYAEGQRRYVESLSAYARQFLGRMEKPDVDQIDGLSPSISIDQKGVSKNPRSTVGTVTEIYDYFRLLFARIGIPHCYNCGNLVQKQDVQKIVENILDFKNQTRFIILSPVIKHMKGQHISVLEKIKSEGFSRVRIDGEIFDLEEQINLEKNKWHNIEIVVDRLIINENIDKNRLSSSIETGLKFGNGVIYVEKINEGEIIYSEDLACVDCNISLSELEPRSFSFNTPFGACQKCTGLGFSLEVDPHLLIRDPNLSLAENGMSVIDDARIVLRWDKNSFYSILEELSIDLNQPIKEIDSSVLNLLFYGVIDKNFEKNYDEENIEYITRYYKGLIPSIEKRYLNTDSEKIKEEILKFMSESPCSDCKGYRLKPESLSVFVLGKNIMEATSLSIDKCYEWINKNSKEIKKLSITEKKISEEIFKEINSRLLFLMEVGLGYITLDRMSSTLSGGEGQRIRLATQIGAGLTGVLYVCDEPSIGLHPTDNEKLIKTLINLKDIGNSVIVVEHDEYVMKSADQIIDMGPRAGAYGGEIIAQGTPNQIMNNPKSLTGLYLSGKKQIGIPKKRKEGSKNYLEIKGASENNLKNIDVRIPLNKFVCVSGISGSGKSTLINDVLSNALLKKMSRKSVREGKYDEINGLENIDKLIVIDQSPIGRTPRSNPATYTGLFTPIRELFSKMPEAMSRGYKAGRFSFNVKGGRCEDCSGAGYKEIEMQFLPDVTIPCEICSGKRYNNDALEIKFKGESIADILDKTVEEALYIFENIPGVNKKLETLNKVGLGYIKLGQPATTLSGGEAQRIKLATELSKRSTGKTLYILDEPTTGLSFDDCSKLLEVLHALVENGNSVLLIEHHLDMIKNSDWIIELGPEAGDKGGFIVCEGTPEFVASTNTPTGKFLAELPNLKQNKNAQGTIFDAKKSKSKTNLKILNDFMPERPKNLRIKKRAYKLSRWRRRKLSKVS
ncbi:MAG: excinuclease ABC subunit UvrA [Dehalococcoidia bacterium]|nr:excinuclease ABC subunit UvrA [Dehalococcoidia bacterium]